MSMSIVIHVLEAVLAFLVTVMSFQIARHYRASVRVAHEACVALERSERLSKQPDSFDVPIVVDSVSSKPTLEEGVDAENPTAQILDDYIGGFFGEPVDANHDMKAFRNVENSEANGLLSPGAGNDQISCVAPAVDLSAYKAFKPALDESIPTLHSPIPESMLTDRFVAQVKELDDEVILVDEPKLVSPASSVMSDKVVLAMLDEAKLVSSS